MSTVLILGATSDIGVAIARKFAQSGYNIQLTAREVGAIASTNSDLAIRYNVSCSVHEFDAANSNMHETFFQGLYPKPDITVYVIGYMGSDDEPLKPLKETRAIIDSNYSGAVSILNIIAKYYAAEKKGTIIGISSVAGERGRQSNFIYGSAKAAFSTYLSGLRNYLYPFNVHVVTVKPGFVYTKMTNHLQLPGLLTATPELVGQCVYNASKNKKNVVYVKWMWRWIMQIIKLIPEPIFKKMKL